MTNRVDDRADRPDVGVRERREQPRESVGAAVWLHLDPEASGQPVLEGNVVDISTRGVRVVTSKQWVSPGAACVVELADAGDGLPAGRITGFVRWAMQDDPDKSVFGVEFEEPLSDRDPEG